jgi:hypothetical protein
MRKFWKWALVLAVPVVWVAAARSAELNVPSGSTIKLLLLRQKSVQEELKITSDQVAKITAFTNKQYAAARKALALDKEKRREKFKALGKENEKFLNDNFKADQLKRLRQISMQMTALMQLRRPRYVKLLKLTKDQQNKIQALQKEARPKLGELLRDKDAKKKTEAFAKLREETRKKVLALLTAKQKVIIRKIVGERFKGKIEFEKYMGEDGD